MPADSHDRHAVPFSDFLRSFTRVLTARPWVSIVLLIAVCIASSVYTSRNLKFKNDRGDLIDPNADFQKRWLEYTKSFGEASDIVVVVEGQMPEDIEPVLDDLGERLKGDDRHFRNVLYRIRIEQEQLRRKGLQFLSAEQLELCLAHLEELRPVIQGDYDTINLEQVISTLLRRLNLLRIASAVINRDPASVSGPSNMQAIQLISQHVTSLATSMIATLKNPKDVSNPWPQLVSAPEGMSEAATKPTYFLNDRGTQGFVQVAPIVDKSDFSGATVAIQHLRAIVAEVQAAHPHVRIGLTGIPVLENDEMLRSQRDMTLSTIVSAIGVLLLLLAGFHGYRHPLMAMAMLTCGLLWACAYATAAVGHLTILSASFAAILMGLGIDFAIVYLSRYLELRHNGESLDEALGNTSASIGASILTAAFTTSLAFYCATFTKFLGVAELGKIAGGGVMLCALAAFLVLPPLLRLMDRNATPAQLPTPIQGNRLRWATMRYPWVVVLASLYVAAYFGAKAIEWNGGRPQFAVGYDHNLLNLQAKGVESVELQHRIFRESNGSLLFAVSTADSLEEVRRLKQQFEKLPTVRRAVNLVEELAAHTPLPSNREERKLLIQAVHSEVARLAPVKYAPRVVNPEALGMLIERLHDALALNTESWAQQAAESLNEFLDRFESLPVDKQMSFLNQFQQRMNVSLHAQLQSLAAASDPEPLTMADYFGRELVSRYVSAEGKWQLQIFPKEQVWDIGPLRDFVEDVRSIDPEVTGTPLQNYEASRQIMQSYQDAAVYALIAIFLVLLLDLLGGEQAARVLLPAGFVLIGIVAGCRWQKIDMSWELIAELYLAFSVTIALLVNPQAVFHAMLTLLPPFGGAAIMFGLMHLLQLDLNPANLIVLPLLLGIGVDGGVHVVHDFRNQAKRRYRISPSIINSLVLTSMTTMVGFGSMLLAAHRGLYTFGLVLTLGVASCLFMSLIPLPAILTLLDRRRRASLMRVSHVVVPVSGGGNPRTPAAHFDAAIPVRQK